VCLLRGKFPQFEVFITRDEQVVVRGFLGGNDMLTKCYEIVVRLPDTYGTGTLPEVYVLNETIPPGTPHTFSGNRLCLVHDEKTFGTNSTIVVALGWTCCWLVAYEMWKFHRANIWDGSS